MSDLEAQEVFPDTLKVNKMNVLYFFVIYRLYLNYNDNSTAERQVIQTKNFAAMLFQHRFLSENFLLEKSKELLKINLVFRP